MRKTLLRGEQATGRRPVWQERQSRRDVQRNADKMLRVYRPEERDTVAPLQRAAGAESLHFGADAHRTTCPGRTNPAPEIPTVDPRIRQLSQSVAAKSEKLIVPVDQVPNYAALPLRAWYQCEKYGPAAQRRAEIASGRNKKGTADKDVTALGMWERVTRPSGWTSDWPGISIDSITDDYLSQFAADAIAAGNSRDYVLGCFRHLKWMLSVAVDRGVLASKPKGRMPKLTEDSAAPRTLIYENDGGILSILDAIHDALAEQLALQTAFILSVSAGPRSVDLFGLKWRNVDLGKRPQIEFVATKTGKHQRVPLAPCVAARLLFWKSRQTVANPDDLVFPELTSRRVADPEKSRAARRRNAEMKAAVRAAGFDFDGRTDANCKPWQVGRATCNERLQRMKQGVGDFVLGHSTQGVNAANYRQPTSDVFKTIQTLEQPPTFLADPACRQMQLF